MSGFMEWLGRVVMLVLAGMITLSIIGAIAAIPSGSIGTRPVAAPRDWTPPPVQEEPPPIAAPGPEPGRQAAPSQTQPSEVIAEPASPLPATAADWLEAITYALLALVGLGIAGILLLWRALLHWRRSADALEALAGRTS